MHKPLLTAVKATPWGVMYSMTSSPLPANLNREEDPSVLLFPGVETTVVLISPQTWVVGFQTWASDEDDNGLSSEGFTRKCIPFEITVTGKRRFTDYAVKPASALPWSWSCSAVISPLHYGKCTLSRRAGLRLGSLPVLQHRRVRDQGKRRIST